MTMHWRQAVLIALAALLAAMLGLVASVAIYGPGPLLRSPLGQRVLGDLLAGEAPSGVAVLVVGDVVPVFSLPGLDGPSRTLPMPGRAVLINYWASWCQPCREEMPLLSDFASRQGPEGVQVVGIALDEAADARAFLAGRPVAFPVLLEAPGPADSSVRLGNGPGVLPYSVLIGSDGRLKHRRFGNFSSAQDLRDWLAEAR